MVGKTLFPHYVIFLQWRIQRWFRGFAWPPPPPPSPPPFLNILWKWNNLVFYFIYLFIQCLMRVVFDQENNLEICLFVWNLNRTTLKLFFWPFGRREGVFLLNLYWFKIEDQYWFYLEFTPENGNRLNVEFNLILQPWIMVCFSTFIQLCKSILNQPRCEEWNQDLILTRFVYIESSLLLKLGVTLKLGIQPRLNLNSLRFSKDSWLLSSNP